MEVDIFRARESLRQAGQSSARAIGSKQNTKSAAGHGQDQAFGEELTNDASLPCSERGANGKLTASSSGSREQQVRHVDASDQQDKSNRAQQGNEVGLNV